MNLRTSLDPLDNQRGQGLTEAAIIISLFVLLSMGIVEFGRAWMVANMITAAARDGARAMAIVNNDPANRSSDGTISDTVKNAIRVQMKNEIKTVLDSSTVDAFPPADLEQILDPLTGLNVVQVRISGEVPYIFNLVGASSFGIGRQVTFRDEGR